MLVQQGANLAETCERWRPFSSASPIFSHFTPCGILMHRPCEIYSGNTHLTEALARRILERPAHSAYQEKVPATHFTEREGYREFTKRVIRLFQIGFSEKHHPKSRAAFYAVRDILQTIFYGEGPRTHEHWMEIMFTWPIEGEPTLKPNDAIPDFSLVVFIGTAVTMAHMLFAVMMMESKSLEDAHLDDVLKKDLALRTMKCLAAHVCF